MINEAIRILIPSSCGGEIAAPNDFRSKHAYYEQLVLAAFARGVTTDRLHSLGMQLASLARIASATRRPDDVEKIIQLMRALPLPKSLQAVTNYYEARRLRLAGQFDASERMLYQAAEHVAPEYKARVFRELGNCYYDKGQVCAAAESFVIAGALGLQHDPLTFVQSQQLIASIQSYAGDASWAVKTFESIFPVVLATTRSSPVSFFEYLNNYAVRLGEVGRVDEAQAALNVALSSRYAPAFPEWAETRAELETKRKHPRPSFVSLSFIRPLEPEPLKKPATPPKPKRTRVPVIIRVFHWLAGYSIFTSVASARIFTSPTSVDIEALLPITTDWLKNGPSPRAPPLVVLSIST